MNSCPKCGWKIFFTSFIFILFWISGIYLGTKCAKIMRGWYLTGIQDWAFTRTQCDSSSLNLPNQHLLVSSSKKYIKYLWFPEFFSLFNGGDLMKYSCFCKTWDPTKCRKMRNKWNITFTSNRPIWQRNSLSRKVSKEDWMKHQEK